MIPPQISDPVSEACVICSLLVGASAIPSGTTSCPHLGFGTFRASIRGICLPFPLFTITIVVQIRSAAPTSSVERWSKHFQLQFHTFRRLRSPIMSPATNIHIPPVSPAEPGPLASDFFQQQLAKQRNNNYHSTSLRNMVAASVNRTALHPGGVQYVLSLSSIYPFLS